MRAYLLVVLAVLAVSAVSAAEAPGCGARSEAIPYRVLPADSFAAFVKNWSGDQALQAVIRTPAEWDAVFSPAVVMGNPKPTAPEPEFFRKEQLLVVAKVTPAPGPGENPLLVKSLVSVANGNGQVLIYRYVPPAAPATYQVKSVLILAVPKEYAGPFHFVEDKGVGMAPLPLSGGK